MTPGGARLLLVDDDPLFAESIRDLFSADGIDTVLADSLRAARAAIHRGFDIVLLDHHLPDGEGLELLEGLGRVQSRPKAIMVTGRPELNSAVDALRLGLEDYLTKPVDLERLRQIVLKVAEKQMRSYGSRAPPPRDPPLLGGSKAHRELLRNVELAARHRLPVLITGETGVGKTRVARAIHESSDRAHGPFIKVNCATLPSTLAEAELFGATRGAYTGSSEDRLGLVALADGGTLFLDEVGEMGVDLQAKLLSCLDDATVRPLGGRVERAIDVRVIAATNRNLDVDLKKGTFRPDLFYRLAVFPIAVPPLRGRGEDLQALADAFLKDITGNPKAYLDRRDIPFLEQHPFPGNIRELRNMTERAAVTQTGPIYRVLFSMASNHPPLSHPDPQEPEVKIPTTFEPLATLERRHILKTLELVSGNRQAAAQHLQISVATLRRKLKQYESDGLFERSV